MNTNLTSDRGSAVRHALRKNILPITFSIGLVAAATLCLIWATEAFNLRFITLIYLIPVIIVATRWGLVLALATTLMAAASADFFFYHPLYSLWMADPQEIADVILFLIVAVVTGKVAASLRTELEKSRRREAEVSELYAFSRRLAGCASIADFYSATQGFLSNHLGRRSELIGAATEAMEGKNSAPQIPPEVFSRAHEVLQIKEFRSELVKDNTSGEVWLVRPVSAETRDYGVIVVNLGDETGDIEAARRQIASILSEATDRLNRLDMSRTIRSAKLRAESDVLKDALIGSVSHELRNPLTSILGSASMLVSLPEIQRDTNLAMLARATHEEAMRLSDQVQKLLQATRVKAQGIQPALAIFDPTDIVNAALALRSARLASYELDVEIAPDLPLIEVDGVLVEQVLCELLENAAKYSSGASAIEVSAFRDNEHVVLAVSDHGQGLTLAEQSEIFQRPFRGERHGSSVSGSGLGLWIAHTLVAACGGTLTATSGGPGLGTVVSMRFPVKLDMAAAGHAYE